MHYYFSDHLGSSNVVTNSNGASEEESDFYPYGGERVIVDTLPDQNYKFTGKERDSESGLDYFGARYYSSTMGRWLSPDWASVPTAVPYADFGNPQSLNLYGYVGNNPLRHADPNGHCWPLSACVAQLGQALDRHVQSVTDQASKHGPAAAAYTRFTQGVVADTIKMVAAPFTVGAATGTCMGGNGCSAGKTALAVGGDALKAAAIAAPLASVSGKALGALSEAGTNTSVVTTGTRYVGSGEASVIEGTGMVPNTNAAGAPKQVFYTPESPLSSASEAQSTYQLPETPTHVAELDTSGVNNTYGGNVENGSGIEMITQDQIPVTRLKKLTK